MKLPTDKKLAIYSSLFIAIAINLPRLIASRENLLSETMIRLDFGTYESIYQTFYNFLFCLFISFYNLDKRKKRNKTQSTYKKFASFFFPNFIYFAVFALFGVFTQRLFFFQSDIPPIIIVAGYLFRFTLSVVLITIALKIYDLLVESRAKDIENEKLRSLYLKAELGLLKSQLDPHFFFNSLSSLSAIVRENPPKAQQFISHLSKVFRYSLQSKDNNLVKLREEIKAVKSYAELLKMRHENAFQLDIDIADDYLFYEIPHMSLQPLLENAAKHNALSEENPLKVSLKMEQNKLVVANNYQPVPFPEISTGIGLANLNDRFEILMENRIEIQKSGSDFIVKLPLKQPV
ncbi:sensor histidine kinase [Chondrinema litorale]|uniref:sensor histidine kinase n=1 Tax=Chondrinema litorale TaxID=2994555 RepID=UPI002542A439|nr:histidine kinase [Chondrinema litorale]UZR97785.1 histidine kinase [Chondrinema litorale]